MMKRIISAFIASTALLGAHAANAQTWTPSAGTAPTYTWQGLVTVQKSISGPVLTCTLTVEVNNPSTGSTTTGSALLDAPAHPACPFIVLTGAPFPVTYNSGPPETLTFSNVYAFTPLTPGDCSGTISANFNDSTDDSLDIDATLPEVTVGSGDCTIIGNLQLVNPAAVDIT